mgnify:CR=1 FL=1
MAQRIEGRQLFSDEQGVAEQQAKIQMNGENCKDDSGHEERDLAVEGIHEGHDDHCEKKDGDVGKRLENFHRKKPPEVLSNAGEDVFNLWLFVLRDFVGQRKRC